MISSDTLKKELTEGIYRDLLKDIYIDDGVIEYQTNRYIKAVNKFEELYGTGEIEIFSAPGRSEVCGNHTDHQHGEILAASINLDAIAVVRKSDSDLIRIVSDGYDEIVIDVRETTAKEEEKGTTASIIRGVISGAADRGFAIGGFDAYITSDVLIGAGLSSSAAFETVIGVIVSHLFNDGKLDAVTNAIIGQYSENIFFGKPCGLMDQMACSVGSLVHVDFAVPGSPVVEKVDFDLNKHGYSLCITDTKGSHADLTPDYAAVPAEMKNVAAVLGKEVLLGVTAEMILENIDEIREKCGDRAVLRALHFTEENARVGKAVDALKHDNTEVFLEVIKASGNSSYKYLQNVYSNSDVQRQNVSLALAYSEILGDGCVARVHGGGFAGTIQAFVLNEKVDAYKKLMNRLFDEDACKVLQIRKYGGMKVF